MRPVERVLNVVDGQGAPNGKGEYVRFCPAHDDRNTPNLNIGETQDGTAVVWCSAGCEQDRVLDALEEKGVRRADLFPSRNGHGGGGLISPRKTGQPINRAH